MLLPCAGIKMPALFSLKYIFPSTKNSYFADNIVKFSASFMKTTFLFIIFLAFILIYCCGDDTTTGGNGNINDPGILRTDEFGNSLGGDTTDWCMHNPGSFQFKA